MVFPMKGMPAPKGAKANVSPPPVKGMKNAKKKVAGPKGKTSVVKPAPGGLPPQFGGPPK